MCNTLHDGRVSAGIDLRYRKFKHPLGYTITTQYQQATTAKSVHDRCSLYTSSQLYQQRYNFQSSHQHQLSAQLPVVHATCNQTAFLSLPQQLHHTVQRRVVLRRWRVCSCLCFNTSVVFLPPGCEQHVGIRLSRTERIRIHKKFLHAQLTH